jgi:hypothetical protein
MLIAYAPKEAGRKRWVTVGFPGLVGRSLRDERRRRGGHLSSTA